jgi:hypothetical protein
MTAAVIALVASYAVLAILLLSLTLRSAWRWPVKAGAIVVTTGFFAVLFIAVQGMLGWPTEAPPPAQFQLYAALIDEPDRKGQSPGAIYLWLAPREADGVVSEPPRAYALPYSRSLHEATAAAQADLQAGKQVDGAMMRPSETHNTSPTASIELFERPLPPLAPKTG